MEADGVDVLMLSVGSDLPYFCGYEAMPLERITMLVVPREGHATLVIPGLERARVHERPEIFSVAPWGETEDPIAKIADLAGAADTVAIGDHMWAGFLVDLTNQMPNTSFCRASSITSPIRQVKDAEEIARLREAGAAVDRIATRLQHGEIPLVGQTEAAVSAELGRQILEEGHDRVNFAIVAAGENAASPHHHAGERVIQRKEEMCFIAMDDVDWKWGAADAAPTAAEPSPKDGGAKGKGKSKGDPGGKGTDSRPTRQPDE